MRVVLDTNQWVSGLTRPATPPGRILYDVQRGRLEPVASLALVEEMTEVLLRPRVRDYFGITDAQIEEALVLIRHPLVPDARVDAPIRDEKDVPVLSSAVAGRAEVIVSGDKDLHDPQVSAWLAQRGARVATPQQLLAELGGRPMSGPVRREAQVAALARERNLSTYGVEDPMATIARELDGLTGAARMARATLALERLKQAHASTQPRWRPPMGRPDRKVDDRGVG